MAISEESYGRGNPVYSNGSFAPTKGTVDPTGYIDRSLNAPSQKRSGLAEAALARVKNSAPAQVNAGVLPIGDIKTLTISPTGQLIPDTGDSSLAQPQEPQPALSDSASQLPATPVTRSPLAQAALSRLLANGGMTNGG